MRVCEGPSSEKRWLLLLLNRRAGGKEIEGKTSPRSRIDGCQTGTKPACPSVTWTRACRLVCVTQVALEFRLTKGTLEAQRICPFPKKMSEAVSLLLPPTLVIFLGTSAAETCFQEECSKDTGWFLVEPDPNQRTPKALPLSFTEPHHRWGSKKQDHDLSVSRNTQSCGLKPSQFSTVTESGALY